MNSACGAAKLLADLLPERAAPPCFSLAHAGSCRAWWTTFSHPYTTKASVMTRRGRAREFHGVDAACPLIVPEITSQQHPPHTPFHDLETVVRQSPTIENTDHLSCVLGQAGHGILGQHTVSFPLT